MIRRVSFDLIGLPPTPEEVEAFVADTSADAFTKVVDRLLASPRFGERWGRHWLDVARFAESSGKANMMYPERLALPRLGDRRVQRRQAVRRSSSREQIAGDLLPAGDDRERAEHLIATGFLAIGSKTHNTQNRAAVRARPGRRADRRRPRQAFLGLTIACARCHDHKFDPISQRDYYALSGIFQSTQTCYGTLPGVVQNLNPSPLIELPAKAGEPSAVPKLTAERRAALEEQLAELIKDRDALTMEGNFTHARVFARARCWPCCGSGWRHIQPDGTPRTYAMGVRERFEPLDSPLYTRGELDQPGEVVPRGFIQLARRRRTPAITSRGSGRLELARVARRRATTR